MQKYKKKKQDTVKFHFTRSNGNISKILYSPLFDVIFTKNICNNPLCKF